MMLLQGFSRVERNNFFKFKFVLLVIYKREVKAHKVSTILHTRPIVVIQFLATWFNCKDGPGVNKGEL